MRLTLTEVRTILGDPLETSGAAAVSAYSIDSRTMPGEALFFAIRGERFDGHAFVADVVERGAVAAVVARAQLTQFAVVERARLVAVDDTLEALQALAHAVRQRWHGTAIGVTGSVGKTTTKEAIAQVLASRYPTLKSHGNLNNAYGMPLQLLRVTPQDRYAVLEMGMSSAGEIAALAAVAQPQWGVVNTVAAVHTEFFADGIEGVARAKAELVEALPADGIAFLNADDFRVAAMASQTRARVVLFGTAHNADIRASDVKNLGAEGLSFRVDHAGENALVRLQLLGEHNVTNALAAIAVGVSAGIPLAECADALGTMQPPDSRGQQLHVRGALLINDCYNSNPRALDAMVDALAAVPAQRRIVIAGEMLELGSNSAEMHAACGFHAAARGIDLVIGVRGHAQSIVDAAAKSGVAAEFFAAPEEAGKWLDANLREGDAVLLKASRGVRLERALLAVANT